MDDANLDDSGVGWDDEDVTETREGGEVGRKNEDGAGTGAGDVISVPEPLAKFGAAAKRAAKCAFSAAGSVLWVLASSTFLLFGPIVLEVECARMERARQPKGYPHPHRD